MTESKPHFETPQILSDLPLRQDDEAHFHFNEFAITLARLVADPATRTPLSIGISGKWGSGKTTLLKRMQTMLDQHAQSGQAAFANPNEDAKKFRTCKTVWFESWKYNAEDHILVALVRAILAAMKEDGLFNKLKATLEDPQQDEYDLVKMFINAFQFKFGGLGAEVQVGFDSDKFSKESPFVTHTAFFDYFDEAFTRLMAVWVHGSKDQKKIDEKKGALVVFIDDLDRCLPAKTVQVLEAVKLFLDKPGCIFVLGAHTEVVLEAVAQHYQKAGVNTERAFDYLEKIIQLRFELPPILEEQMGAYLKTQKLPEEALENWETIVAGAEINPRKVKTFLNDLNLAWALLVNSDQAAGVERSDFTRWQVLMRAAPKAFKEQVYGIDNPELRFQFVQRALAWQKGDPQAADYFKDFEKNSGLKNTLRKIGAFSERFNAATLKAFIHMLAPPRPSEAEKAPAEVKGAPPQGKGEEISPEEERAKARRVESIPMRPDEKIYAGQRFVQVPQGEFLMGSRDEDELAYSDEKPQHTFKIEQAYWIGRFPVTNDDYAKFVEAEKPQHPWVKDWEKKLDHPVVNVSWQAALAYCAWLNQAFKAELPDGLVFRLPTEAEWEKAARGEFGYQWPWGNQFDPQKCNSGESKIGTTTPVGAYSTQGDSPYGCADMVGNVWEWTNSLFKSYPYLVGDGREQQDAEGARVLRGGSFNINRGNARCACRRNRLPDLFSGSNGFRVVVASPI